MIIRTITRTLDKTPFDKIFKKLLQTVKTMLLFYMDFNFKLKKLSNLDKNCTSKFHFPLKPSHSSTTHVINE